MIVWGRVWQSAIGCYRWCIWLPYVPRNKERNNRECPKTSNWSASNSNPIESFTSEYDVCGLKKDTCKNTQKRFTSIIFVALLDWCPPGRSSQSRLGKYQAADVFWFAKVREKVLRYVEWYYLETKKWMEIMEIPIRWCYSLHADTSFFQVTFWWAPNGGHVFTPEKVTNKTPKFG